MNKEKLKYVFAVVIFIGTSANVKYITSAMLSKNPSVGSKGNITNQTSTGSTSSKIGSPVSNKMFTSQLKIIGGLDNKNIVKFRNASKLKIANNKDTQPENSNVNISGILGGRLNDNENPNPHEPIYVNIINGKPGR